MDDNDSAEAGKGTHAAGNFIGDLYGELQFVAAAEEEPKRFLRLSHYGPGLVLCGTLAIAATWLGEHYNMPTILLGLLLGLALNFTAFDPRAHAGLDLVASQGLRVGIVLIGLQVTLMQIVEIGLGPFIALLAIMGVTFAGGMLGARFSGQSRYAGVLAGGATAICGASAALALYGVIGKDRVPQAQFALTLLCVALASAMAMTVYPALAAQLGFDDRAAGFLIGASVHDVAQAIGGGYSYSDAAGAEAAIIKLSRVALLAPLVLLTSLWLGAGNTSKPKSLVKRLSPPWFVMAFLALAVLNSLVPIPAQVSEGANVLAKALLLMAVSATALRSRTDLIAQLGWRATMPVLGATLASFCSALVFTFLVLR